MGFSGSKLAKAIEYTNEEEVKGDTKPFRSTRLNAPVLAKGAAPEPLPDKLPDGVDTLLKCFE